MKTKTTLFVMLTFLFAVPLFGQTVDELKKQSEQDMQRMRQQQEQLMGKMQQDFNAFVQQADREFAAFLKQSWKEFEAFRAKRAPLNPKPLTFPRFNPETTPVPSQQKEIIPLPVVTPAPLPKQNPPVAIAPEENLSKTGLLPVRFLFYGREIQLQANRKLNQLFPANYNRRTVSRWWTLCSRTEYGVLVNGLLAEKENLQLNDWGYFQLVKAAAKQLAPQNPTHALLLSWFIMIHSGYDMKIASSRGNLFLLFPADGEVYERKYIVVKNRTYYFDTPSQVSTFQTYDYIFPKATRRIDLTMKRSPLLGENTLVKTVSFSFRGRKYTFPVVLNRENLQFVRNYPMTSLPVYFDASMPGVTRVSLDHALKNVLQEMDLNTRIAFLLHFVQTAFAYETDQQQFGREKFFFPQELFYYKGSDCEDRAVLFTWLVRHFTKLPVIGLVYPDHVSAAVAAPGNMPGDYVLYHGKKYWVTDPTYIGAPPGVSMPRYRNIPPKVIPVN